MKTLWLRIKILFFDLSLQEAKLLSASRFLVSKVGIDERIRECKKTVKKSILNGDSYVYCNVDGDIDLFINRIKIDLPEYRIIRGSTGIFIYWNYLK